MMEASEVSGLVKAIPEVLEDGTIKLDHDKVEEVVGSEAEYLAFIGRARAIPDGEVLGCNGDASVALHNINRTQANLAPHAHLQKKLDDLDWELIRAMPRIALALLYVTALAQREGKAPPTRAFQRMLSGAGLVRRIILSACESWSEAGLIPKEKIKPIKRGSGGRDLAGDLLKLVEVAREYGLHRMQGTPVTEDLLRRASETAMLLHQSIRPAGARPEEKVKGTQHTLVSDRDRLWTLLLTAERHQDRWAGYVWGREASKHVATLTSRVRVKAKAAKPKADAPKADEPKAAATS